MKLEVVVTSDDRGAEDRVAVKGQIRMPINMHRTGVRGNPVRHNPFILDGGHDKCFGVSMDMGHECPGKLIVQEVENEMRGFGVVLLIVALLLVGLHAFGSVNQYENEAGLTVDALMLPLAGKIVEARGVDFMNEMVYVESAIAISNNYNEAPILIIPYKYNGTLMVVNPATGYILGGIAVRLKFPSVSYKSYSR
jgi:hypothetical protein